MIEKEDKVNPLYGSRNDAFLSSTSTGTAIQRGKHCIKFTIHVTTRLNFFITSDQLR